MAYHPTMGRWAQRDPAGYVDGADLYEYVGSSPIGNTDASGLEKLPPATQSTTKPAGSLKPPGAKSVLRDETAHDVMLDLDRAARQLQQLKNDAAEARRQLRPDCPPEFRDKQHDYWNRKIKEQAEKIKQLEEKLKQLPPCPEHAFPQDPLPDWIWDLWNPVHV